MPVAGGHALPPVHEAGGQEEAVQGIINKEFGRYLTPDEAFIFIGKRRTTAKILHREAGWLTMYVRKLTSGRFRMPKAEAGGRSCTVGYAEFVRLIMGEGCETRGAGESGDGFGEGPGARQRRGAHTEGHGDGDAHSHSGDGRRRDGGPRVYGEGQGVGDEGRRGAAQVTGQGREAGRRQGAAVGSDGMSAVFAQEREGEV